jgi:hypothetical protein
MRRLFIGESPLQGRCPASEVNDGGCPEKPDHLSQPASIASPDWHSDVLMERRQRLLDGSATSIPWHDAKAQLQRLAE